MWRPASPQNGVTGGLYHGINVLVLAFLDPRPMLAGDPRWATYQQAHEAGYQVRKSEKATTIFFAKQLEVENRERDETKGDPDTRTVFMLKPWSVFHFSQMDGLPAYSAPSAEEAPWTRPDAAQKILDNSGAVVRIGGDRAFYRPATGHIQLPRTWHSRKPARWAATTMHELSHWTGAKPCRGSIGACCACEPPWLNGGNVT